MGRKRDFETVLIRRACDVSPGDIIFTANEHPTVHLVAHVYEIKEELGNDKRLSFIIVSSGTGKVYDLNESYVGLLKMQKIVFKP